MKIEFSSQRREMLLFLTTKRGGRRVQTLQNDTEIYINTAQNNIRNPQTALKLPENFYIRQTARFCRNTVLQIKIKISAKSHPKSSKTASPQTLTPPPPTWLPWHLVQTSNQGHSTWFIQLQTNREQRHCRLTHRYGKHPYAHLALVVHVQRLDSSIHQINLCPMDSAISFPSTYPLDSDLSGGWRYPTF